MLGPTRVAAPRIWQLANRCAAAGPPYTPPRVFVGGVGGGGVAPHRDRGSAQMGGGGEGRDGEVEVGPTRVVCSVCRVLYASRQPHPPTKLCSYTIAHQVNDGPRWQSRLGKVDGGGGREGGVRYSILSASQVVRYSCASQVDR